MKKEESIEFLDEYRERLKTYCYACADVSIKYREEDQQYYLTEELKECLYIMGGHFDAHWVANELRDNFPFEDVNREGYWHFEFLLKYIRGDYEEPSYMDLLLTEASFVISFKDKEQQDLELSAIDFPF